jgi:NAD(P)-dependent dehydrogenase (short-subunit alcohol dehydrogenase family)
MNGTRRLDGKVVIVTGAGTGIGRTASLIFAQEGARLAIAGRREAELNEVASAITAADGEVIAVPTDVSQSAQVDRLVDAAVQAFGGLDVVFSNAGISGSFKPIIDQTDDDFDTVINVNLRGVWLLARAAMRVMQGSGRGGSIINTSSFVAEACTPGTSSYAASKAGVDALTRNLALEGGPHGIRANAVAPGVIRTPMSAGIEGELAHALTRNTAIGRLGEPADVAEVAVWLATDAARYVTGQTLLVDGGFAIPGLR